MEDVQFHAPDVALAIDRVGVRDLSLPVLVRDRAKGRQQTVARVDMGVDLPAHFKGTHMSRFVQALESWNEEISYQSVHRLLDSIKTRLQAQRAWVRFSFPYFMEKAAPATGITSLISYQCSITGQLDEKGQSFQLDLDVPVMTVCPCSKAISREGAHSQRANVHMQIHMTGFSWLEEFIELAEEAGSCDLFSLLKREDEKFVTEHAFAHPVFVEDVVRHVARSLSRHEHVGWFSVEVESMESIHNHNAFAHIEGGPETTSKKPFA